MSDDAKASSTTTGAPPPRPVQRAAAAPGWRQRGAPQTTGPARGRRARAWTWDGYATMPPPQPCGRRRSSAPRWGGGASWRAAAYPGRRRRAQYQRHAARGPYGDAAAAPARRSPSLSFGGGGGLLPVAAAAAAADEKAALLAKRRTEARGPPRPLPPAAQSPARASWRRGLLDGYSGYKRRAPSYGRPSPSSRNPPTLFAGQPQASPGRRPRRRALGRPVLSLACHMAIFAAACCSDRLRFAEESAEPHYFGE